MKPASTQSDRSAAAGSDSHGDRSFGGGIRSPQLQAVTETLAWSIARLNELEHRIYVLERQVNDKEGETRE